MRRASVLVLLLVLPALGGCIDLPEVTFPLDASPVGEPLEASVLDGGGHVAGREVVLEATPVLEGASYVWTLDGDVVQGPTLRRTLEAGEYEVVLTVVRGLQVLHVNHALTVAPAEGEDGDGPDDGDGSDGDGGDDGEGGGTDDPAPCGFTTESISVGGSGNLLTFRFPWTCQPDSWEWDLGDGTRSRAATVEHEFRRVGSHTVKLTIVHDGQTRTHTKTVQVQDVPLRIVPTVDGPDVTFALDWGREVTEAQWSFGDGGTSVDREPTHRYDSAGKTPQTPWVVTATAKDAAGETATTEHELYLDAYPLLIEPDVQQDTVGLSFQWGWPVERVEWTPGDGCTFLASEAGDEAPTVRCRSLGDHHVRLEVEGTGRTAVATATFAVTDLPARIHAVLDMDRVTATADAGTQLVSHQWSVDGVVLSQAATLTHETRDFGTFTLGLRAVDAQGEVHLDEAEVVVEEVRLKVEHEVGLYNTLTATLDWAPADAIAWDFGDGSTAATETVTHPFRHAGTYTVTLTVSSDHGEASWTQDVTVEPEFVPRVVVAVPDSGINPYHEVYRRPDLQAHPCTYVEGYPCSIPALELTLDAATYEEAFAADEDLWKAIRPGDAYWIPGTNIIAALCQEPYLPEQDPAGLVPTLCILDENDPHGTHTTSSVLSENPEALIAFAETPSGSIQPFLDAKVPVDVFSHSWGPPAPVPLPRGQGDVPAFYVTAAGNEGGFPVVLEGSKTHPNVITVGGADGASQTEPGVMSWKTPEFVSEYCRPVAATKALSGEASACGTSFSAPTFAGALSAVLLDLRKESGYTGSVADGKADPVLGVSKDDVRAALRSAATYDATGPFEEDSDGVPLVEAAPYVQYGWGYFARQQVPSALLCIRNDLCPAKSDEAVLFMETMMDYRETVHGVW